MAKKPSAVATCATVQSKAVEQQAAAVGPSPGRSHCCALGFMRRSVPQLEGSDDPSLLATEDLHIYTEVSLYRGFARTGCACSWVVWVTSMQAAIAGQQLLG